MTALNLSELNAEIARKGLTKRAVAALAGVEYVRATEILNGRRMHAASLAKIARAVHRASSRREVAA